MRQGWSDTSQYPGRRRLMLIVTGFSGFSCMMGMIAIAPIMKEVARSLSVNVGIAGQLLTVSAFTGAVGLIFAGVVYDRYGITFVLVVGLLCVSLPATLMPWIGDTYNVVFICRLLLGLSIGCIVTTISGRIRAR